MNILFLLILIALVIFLIYNGENSGKRGDHKQSSQYFRLSILIILATIGAVFYPSLKEKVSQLKKKYNSPI